ncbi:hypothetical protein D1609_09160 [Leptospira borgpetersenii serovar Hardjo-bovis]|nr:hypothetical protein D1609_09160 [Leptospira borgpetersenii serovar Hardjo-bovis]
MEFFNNSNNKVRWEVYKLIKGLDLWEPLQFIQNLSNMIATIFLQVLRRALIWRPIRSSKSFFAYFLNHPII